MLQKVRKYIEQHALIAPRAKVVIGLSGGADSIAMLDILMRLDYDCIAAHCNFHLRGDESDRDALFVKGICEANNIPLHMVDFETEQYAAGKSISIEMAARELRYQWFEKLRNEVKADYIAVAHHRDDSIETVLLNLIRGTGIRGLTGIPVRNGAIIRPLLCLSREEILAYIAERSLSYVDDHTNSEDIYTRNRIRLKVLPLLETINPSVRDSIAQTAQYLSQAEHIYTDYVESAKQAVFDGGKIDIALLQQQSEPEAVLFEILYDYGFHSDVTRQVYFSLDSLSGKVFLSDTHKLVKDRDFLLLSALNKESEQAVYEVSATGIDAPVRLIMAKHPTSGVQIEKHPNILYLDYNKLQFPLKLRRWERGDWFIPFGMTGKKKVSDYFSDNKFSLIDKENTWLLCNGEDIIWVVGHRSDNRYRIGADTKTVLQISLEG
ncbi:tRNA lysidine(34) synthetase TilS [Dysgonomonas sp. 25]|uniref:tRNA lysidine(34) synthetase TilS n=1 Tax=Dysgonomonas sp. 25 TaxID=2302933 RepID=UPI0013D22E41|nr:tRNA lysidine(34) synthetase TilS [Dysgonomonas sp. 25]NDV67629.1 tRNA lysidine(34) synthetase TilS [Dysgonomonas sp. 25]